MRQTADYGELGASEDGIGVEVGHRKTFSSQWEGSLDRVHRRESSEIRCRLGFIQIIGDDHGTCRLYCLDYYFHCTLHVLYRGWLSETHR